MSDYKWYDEPDRHWHTKPQRVTPQPTLHEREKPRIVIYDASGQPYARPKQPLGFDLIAKYRT